eukprot:4501492-Prymnesium_polylepis.3
MLHDAAASPGGARGALLWLDAHYSAGDTAGASQREPPLLAEVRAVLNNTHAERHGMAIDDLRDWTGKATHDMQLYPRPSLVQSFVCSKWPAAAVRVVDDTVHIWPEVGLWPAS